MMGQVDDYIDANMEVGGLADINDIRGGLNGINAIDKYELVYNAYHGTGGFKDGSYLIKHPRERSFEERKGYSFYLNYFKPICDSLVNPIFKNPANREYESELYDLFVENCDRGYTGLNEFMRTASKIAKRDGVVFIVMDSPEKLPISLQETIDNRAIPYIYLKKASEVVYSEMSKYGVLEKIAFSELGDVVKSGQKRVIQYRVWSMGGWELYKEFEDGKFKGLIKSGELPNGLFPIIPYFTNKSENGDIKPEPPLYDIARLNAGIYNLWSELREIQRKQGFSILAIPGKPETKQKTTGTGSALYYDPKDGGEPRYIQPEVDVQRGYLEAIQSLIEEIYKQSKLSGVSGVVQNSGIAKQWDFAATDTELQDLARICERVEIKLADLFMRWTNSNFEFSISYPEDFGVVDIDSNIERYERFASQGMPIEVLTKAKKELVREYFSNLDREQIAELEGYVDKLKEDVSQSNLNEES